LRESYPMLLIPQKRGKFVISFPQISSKNQVATRTNMKKSILLFIAFLFFNSTYSQPEKKDKKSSQHKNSSSEKGWYVKLASFQAAKAIGEFSISHSAGFGADFSMEHHKENRFLYFIATAGATHYLGKNVTVSGYPYKYPGNTFIHLMGGIYTIPGNLNIRIIAGPALSLFNGNARFNITGRLEVNYTFKNDLLLGPVLNLMKEPGTNSLLSVGIKLSMRFWPK